MAYRNTGAGRYISKLTTGKSKKSLSFDLLIYNFDSDSAKLKPPHMAALNKLVTLWNAAYALATTKYAMVIVEFTIVGAADKTGDPSSNDALAKRRADEALKYLRPRIKGKIQIETQSRGHGSKEVTMYIRVISTGLAKTSKANFHTLKWENLTLWLIRPTKTPAGGKDQNRAVFARVNMTITPAPVAKKDLDYLINKAYVICGIYAIAAAIAEIGKMHTSQTSTFSTKSDRKKLETEIKSCITYQVLGDVRSLGGAMGRMSVDQIAKEVNRLWASWSKKLDLID